VTECCYQFLFTRRTWICEEKIGNNKNKNNEEAGNIYRDKKEFYLAG
jgi:hypothetical protein